MITEEQVDNLISKNQAFQILYLQHYVNKTLIIMYNKCNEIHENLILTKLTTIL